MVTELFQSYKLTKKKKSKLTWPRRSAGSRCRCAGGRATVFRVPLKITKPLKFDVLIVVPGTGAGRWISAYIYDSMVRSTGTA